MEEYTCKDAKKDINSYFLDRRMSREKKIEALNRAIAHMTEGSTVGKHNISCRGCWEYKEEMKKQYCGG